MSVSSLFFTHYRDKGTLSSTVHSQDLLDKQGQLLGGIYSVLKAGDRFVHSVYFFYQSAEVPDIPFYKSSSFKGPSQRDQS